MRFSSVFFGLCSVTAAAAQAESLTTPPPAPPVPAHKVGWRAANCSGVIVDAKALPDKRWEAAGASEALEEVFQAWRNYTTGPDEVKFEFSQFVSWYFGGPEAWRCSEIFDVPCSTSLTCEATQYPAGHLILNSFSKLHQFHHRYFEALGLAQADIQSEIDFFSESFSLPPPEDPSKDANKRLMLNVAYGLFGVSQAFLSNFVIFSSAAATTSAISQVWRSQIMSTLSYSVFTGWAVAKDYLLPGKDSKAQYGSLSAMMGDVFDSWKATQVAYVETIFNPNDTATEDFIRSALDNGLMGAAPDEMNAFEMSKRLQKLFYPRFIAAVWQTRRWTKKPFVLKTNLPCNTEKGQRDSTLWPFLKDDDHARASTCYKGALFYLIDVRGSGVKLTTKYPSIRPDIFKSKHWPLMALYGLETMDGVRYGGITKEDIVASVYKGWVEGGHQNNNFNPNYTDISPQGNLDLWLQQGHRSPGFVNMTLCQNLYTIVGNIVHGNPENHTSYPCESLSVIKPTNLGPQPDSDAEKETPADTDKETPADADKETPDVENGRQMTPI
ncbi:hypothetical protein CH35J_006311 [Colletotrichum higginsianum]|uniref:Class 5 chitinase chi100 n=1 Tax=Colletotrichum higginsianum TaxID=80884 RepID=A0A4T0W321_9PEZI|nr:hypothetical protein CH35J_006311 [Colletotrichum higginsianum]